MSDPAVTPTPSNGSSTLEERRFRLEERKQTLEESWPKKWGAVMLGAAATLAAAVVTAGFGLWQHESDKHHTDAEKEAEIQVARINANNELAQKKLENDRSVVALYLQYLAGDDPDKDPQLQQKLDLVSRVANDPKLLAPLYTAKVSAASLAGAQPSDVLRGSPSLIASQASYAFSDFVAYIQYARNDMAALQAAQKLQATAALLGFDAPGLQRVGEVPDVNEIRIYKPEHRSMAASLAQQLAAKGNGHYCIHQLPNSGSLPNGIIELWVGKADAPSAGASC